MNLTEQRNRATHLSIIFIFPHTLSFPILFPSTSIMCFQTILFFSQPRSNITRRRQCNGFAWISGCLPDISACMKEHHLQLNLAKTELLVFPATPILQHDFTIQQGTSTITPSTLVRNLGVIFDDQLTFKEHTAKTARSCRFALHNIRKIRPFLIKHAAQLLVQALVISRLDYCNALLAGLPSNTIKPLQMIQNAAARLVFNEPKRAHVTPLFISLHWLPVAAHIKFKTLMLAYRTTTGSAPAYFHSLLRIYIPSRSLRSASE